MAFLALLCCLVVSATAFPQSGKSYGYGSTSSHSSLSSYTNSFENVPEGCQFISSEKRTEGNVIYGEYKYEDPVGSIITVTYSVNVDGTNYQEKRKVVKGYETDSTLGGVTVGLTADEVVTNVISSLEATVVRIIRLTVQQSSDIDLSNTEALVQTIVIQLRPVVTSAVFDAIETSGNQNLDRQVLIDRILTEITPFVRRGVQQEVATVAVQTVTVSQDEVVTTVINGLRGNVERIIRETVAQSESTLLQNPGRLVQTIIVRLRPVVSQAVQSAIVSTNTNYNVEVLTNRIIDELTPFIQGGVQQQVEIIQQQQRANVDEVVQIVIADLKPSVIQVIREIVRSNVANIDKQPRQLVQTIITQLRPIVVNEVNRAISTSTTFATLDASDLAERIIVEITPFVTQGVRQEITVFKQETTRVDPEVVIKSIITKLRPIVIRVIKSTVSSSSVNLGNEGQLVQTIATQLTPVVRREVNIALGQNQNTGIDGNTLATQIITRLTPFIREGVRKEVKKVQTTVQTTSTTTTTAAGGDQDLIAKIIAQLKPVILGTIKSSQGSVQTTQTQTVQVQPVRPVRPVKPAPVRPSGNAATIAKIIAQLRPVITTTVANVIESQQKTSSGGVSSSSLSTGPFATSVTTTVEETTSVSGGNSGDIAGQVIVKLRPTIIALIKEALAAQQVTKVTKLAPAQSSTAVSNVLVKLRPIIKDAVKAVMIRLQQQVSSLTQEQLISQVQAQMADGLIIELLEIEIRSIVGSNAPLPERADILALFQEMMPQVRQIIIEEIRIYRENNPQLSRAAASQIVSTVVDKLRSVVKQYVVEVMVESGSSLSDQQIAEKVIARMQSIIFQTMERELTGHQISVSGSFTSSAAFQELMDQIIAQIRAIIVQEIRIYRAEQAKIQQQQVVTVQTTKPAGGRLTAIFGTGGANKVKVDTPSYNYGYEFDK